MRQRLDPRIVRTLRALGCGAVYDDRRLDVDLDYVANDLGYTDWSDMTPDQQDVALESLELIPDDETEYYKKPL